MGLVPGSGREALEGREGVVREVHQPQVREGQVRWEGGQVVVRQLQRHQHLSHVMSLIAENFLANAK